MTSSTTETPAASTSGVLRAWVPLFVLALSFPVETFSGTLSIAQIAGYYTANSHCTVVEGGKVEPCDPPFDDWLRIEPVDASHARVQLYSIQTMGAECEVDGVARWDGHALIYKESDRTSPDFGAGFRIEFAKKTIKFRSFPNPSSPAIFSPFCGPRASLDFVKFPMP